MRYNRTALKHAALAVFEQPEGITWHEVVALLDFFEEVRDAADKPKYMQMSSHIRLLGVLDYLRAADKISAEQYEALAKLADDIE